MPLSAQAGSVPAVINSQEVSESPTGVTGFILYTDLSQTTSSLFRASADMPEDIYESHL